MVGESLFLSIFSTSASKEEETSKFLHERLVFFIFTRFICVITQIRVLLLLFTFNVVCARGVIKWVHALEFLLLFSTFSSLSLSFLLWIFRFFFAFFWLLFFGFFLACEIILVFLLICDAVLGFFHNGCLFILLFWLLFDFFDGIFVLLDLKIQIIWRHIGFSWQIQRVLSIRMLFFKTYFVDIGLVKNLEFWFVPIKVFFIKWWGRK